MRRVGLAGTALVLVSATACSGGAVSGMGDGDGTLTLAVGVTATPWDLASAGLGDYINYYEPVFDSLVRLDRYAEATPNLATSWRYDTSRTVLTMKLRKGVRFTDGTALDAAAVKANLLHTKEGTNEAAGKLRAIRTVDAVNPSTVAIHLSAPDPSLITSLGDPSGMVASPKALDGKKGPVGSGPYVLNKSGTTNGSVYTFTRNRDYWNTKAFPFKKIVIRTISDPTARLNALLGEQVDWARIDPRSASQVKGRGLQVSSHVDAVEGLYIWDRAGKIVPALGKVKVRQALNYAFDRDAIAKKINMGYAFATSQMAIPESGAYEKSLQRTYPYDPGKARKLLAEAGYPHGFTVTMPDVSSVAAGQQAVMTQALEDIGVKVKTKKVPSTELFTSLQRGKYAMSWFKLASYRPWDYISTQLTADGAWNPAKDFDPKLAKLIATARKATGARQNELFKQINRYVQTNAFNAPWDVLDSVHGVSNSIKVTPQPFESAIPIYQMTPAS
ncbi:ABC transporter substrate-binding protein [Streptomyces himastatinicus]|nr:ABC transporter substrate-binding protein [Streptomyces himastatinicus]